MSFFISCKQAEKKAKVSQAYSETEKLQPFQEAPDFTLPFLEKLDGDLKKGGQKKLSDFRGKHVLLNFWASWCVPCVREIPDLIELQEKYKDKLTVLFVNCDSESGYSDALEILKEKKIETNVFFDPELTTLETFFITGFPETFFINKAGLVVPIFDPPFNKPQLRLLSDRKWLSAEFDKSIKEVLEK